MRSHCDLFADPIHAGLVNAPESAAPTELSPIAPAERAERLPLSFAQQRLWFLAQIEGGSAAYHIPLALHLKGSLNAAVLRLALDRIMARHEALRTTFHLLNGEPVQRIAPAEESRFLLEEHDLRGRSDADPELDRLAALEAGAEFDLEAGPLIRGRLIRLREDEHALLITMHHIASDAWSAGVLMKELSTLYNCGLQGMTDSLPALEIQYSDYAMWQRSCVEGERLQRQAEYWKDALSGAPALLELPADRPRSSTPDYSGGFAELVLDEQLTAALRDLGWRHGTTPCTTVLAAWAALLSRLSGQQEVVIGTPVANRRYAEVENLIGLFVNPLALRIDLSGSPTVGQLLERIRSRALSAQRCQDVPFEYVVELVQTVRTPAHSPLFQVMFNWQNDEDGLLQLAGVEAMPLQTSLHSLANLDLTLSLRDSGSGIAGGIEYATSLFDAATITRYLDYFRNLLQAMVADDTQAVDRLPMLPESERHRLLYEWNETKTEYPSDKCVHQLFEEQVEKTPDAAAVVFEDTSLSYAELNTKANQLAHYLIDLGVKPDDRVAICAERGLEMVVALLAALKAGGAYVPLDPAYPVERLRFMIEDSTPVVLLTQSHLREIFHDSGDALPVLELVEGTAWNNQPESNPDPRTFGLSPLNLSYVIYTSGSTGMPKGVMVLHRGLCNYLRWAITMYGPIQCALVSSSLSFDATVTSIYTPLLCGGALQMLRSKDEIDGLHKQLCASDKHCLLKLTPSVLDLLGRRMRDDNQHASRNTFVIGGESLSLSTVRLWRHIEPHARLINEYGPTETVVGCAVYEISQETCHKSSVPIGRPIANTRIYILDAHGEPVPVGITGELYIGGAGVARGYLNRPELTAKRFLRDPFVDEPGARMYSTGDLARYLPDGNIEFLGRNDFQVKIRGFRIELGEIEASLDQLPEIRQSAVAVQQAGGEDKHLVAYIVPADTKSIPTVEALRNRLKRSLPDYMIPASFVVLERMQLTANGKLDRKALPGTGSALRVSEAANDIPRDFYERRLAEIWEQLLETRPIGIRSSFFDIGGHSLLAITLFGMIEKSFSRSMPVATIFTSPTIEQLATILRGQPIEGTQSAIEGAQHIAASRSSIVPIKSDGADAPLFLIHGGQGRIVGFYELAIQTGTDHPIYGIQAESLLPGQSAHLRIEDQAARYLSEMRRIQPKGPYYLFGYCYGGLVAYEIAHQLLALGERVAFLGILDAAQQESVVQVRRDDSWRLRLQRRCSQILDHVNSLPPRRKVSYFPERLLSRILRMIYSVAPSLGVRSVPPFLKSVDDILWVAGRKYAPRPWPGQLTIFRASSQTEHRIPPDMGWAALVKEGLEIIEVPGDHFNVFSKENVNVLADRLREQLELSDCAA